MPGGIVRVDLAGIDVGQGPEFARSLERFGEAVALICENGLRFSYGELAAHADAFAARLAPEQRLILIEGCNTPEAVIAYLGALRSGRVVLLHPAGTLKNSAIIERFQPDVEFFRGANGWELTGYDRSTICHPDLSLLLSTSGTTGSSKLVRISAQSLAANANAIAQILDLAPGERALTTLPMFYTYGLSEVNSRLAVGATVLLTERSIVEDELWEFAEREQATSMPGVPHSYELLTRRDLRNRVPSSLRLMSQAGGRLDPGLVKRFSEELTRRGGRLVVMYGQTEATARMSYVPPDRLDNRWDCIGIPIPGGEIALRDQLGDEIIENGRAGELIFRGPNVMMGYAEYREDLERGCDLAELATGDLAERLPDGMYRIIGRLSRFVKPFGLRISLDEIERQLATRGIAAMVAGDDSVIVIAVASDVNHGANAHPASLATDLSRQFGLPNKLFQVIELGEWPILPSGKRDYRALAAMAQRPAWKTDPQASIAKIFTEQFPDCTITVRSSFFELGGDSLNYVNVAVALEEALGQLPDDWGERTVAELEQLRIAAVARPPATKSGVIDADILLRALSIFLVVGNHASANPYVGGGAVVLLLLAGFNLARFNRLALAGGRVADMLKRLVVNVLLPYYAAIVVYGLWKGQFVPSTIFLMANWVTDLRGFLVPFWFISAYVQAMVLVAGLAFLSPLVRRIIDEHPWRFGLLALCASMVLQLVVSAVGLSVPGRSLDAVLPLFALGWSLAFAENPRRRLVVGVATAGYLGFEFFALPMFTAVVPRPSVNEITLPLAILMMLIARRLSLPGLLNRAFVAIAAATFVIYLTHIIVIWTAAQIVGHDNPGLWIAILALVFGVVCHRASLKMARLWRSRIVPMLRFQRMGTAGGGAN